MNAPNKSDAELGMVWWNGLTERARIYWMHRAGDTGIAADAWEAFKGSRDPRYAGLLPHDEHPADFCDRLGITLD